MIALKELTIRAEFRSTVEILITLLHTDTFQVRLGPHPTFGVGDSLRHVMSFLRWPTVQRRERCCDHLSRLCSGQNNTISTAWLDRLIADRMQAEKPDVMVGVICGSLHIADQTIASANQKFQNSLEKCVLEHAI